MAVRFAVLGLLVEAPCHGYRVHALFEERLGGLWNLSYGQVYQILIALEQQGLVCAREESRVGRRPVRKVYAITERGLEALRRWIGEAGAPPRAFRDDFFLRLYFAATAFPDDLSPLVEARLKEIRSELGGVDVRSSSPHQTLPRGEVVHRLFAEAQRVHAEATGRALEQALALLCSRGDAPRPAAIVRGVKRAPASAAEAGVARKGPARTTA